MDSQSLTFVLYTEDKEEEEKRDTLPGQKMMEESVKVALREKFYHLL